MSAVISRLTQVLETTLNDVVVTRCKDWLVGEDEYDAASPMNKTI